MRLTSSAFTHGEGIPAKYTCDGENINPPLRIEEVPEDATSLAFIMDDPDAPMGLWVHWVMWNITPDTTVIAENSVPVGAGVGVNTRGKNQYGGPCPPDREHRYFFKLYALDVLLDLPTSTTKEDLEHAMQGHVLEQAELMGRYERKTLS